MESDKMYAKLGSVQKSMRSVPVPKRILLAVAASIAMIWVMLQSQRLHPLPYYKAIYGAGLLDDINNSTLGVSWSKLCALRGSHPVCLQACARIV